MKPTGNMILITGAGSGIGRALAHRFHDLGNHVIAAGRRRSALEETARGHPRMSVMELDVDDPAAIAAFAREITAAHPALNILINNSGIMRSEDITRSRDLTDAEATVVTNLLGPIRMIDALVDHLAGQPNAAIVNVTSGLAFVPLPRTPTYSATKAAIHSYTLSLREQLRDQVEVIELVPPGVQTELTPGQSKVDAYMPLTDFIDEVMTLFQTTPTPAEITVQRVLTLRNAEREGRSAQMLAMLAGH